MCILSKRQKINLFKEGIKNLENGSDNFICNAIPGLLNVNFEPIPEILKYKPEITSSEFWWFTNGKIATQKCIEILKKVIKDIENA